jgi:hypothetical protein
MGDVLAGRVKAVMQNDVPSIAMMVNAESWTCS